MKRLIVGISGASGVIYGVRLLQVMAKMSGWETDLVMSAAAVGTLTQELDLQRSQVETLATCVHNVRDIGASIASGSTPSAGMIIAPWSMRTLGAIAHGLGDNLRSSSWSTKLSGARSTCSIYRTPVC